MSPKTRRLLHCVLIFLLAFGIRFLYWRDTRLEVGKVQTGVTADYRRVAQLLRDGGIGSFFSSSSPLSDPGTLGHPPGYSILLATTASITSDAPIQFLQMLVDALSAVVIFLIVVELFSLSVATIAGLFAAFAPQFGWNSVLLLPDTLAVFPILVAVYVLVRATKHPRLRMFVMVGALIGISCWLRANAMLMTVFFAGAVFLLVRKDADARRAARSAWGYAVAVVAGTILIVAPLTIRNAIVFHRLIPVSLGAGQTLLEGIADYDRDGRFGIPATDVGIQQQEADAYHRPEYANTLFTPDGIERERGRLSRGFAVIRSHPLWFAGVMLRRASMMLRLERTPLLPSGPGYLRGAVHALERIFLTAVFLPLSLIGLIVIIVSRQRQSLLILSIVPLYYFIVQSIVHTEYRYVMPVVYFLFAFAAVGVMAIANHVIARATSFRGASVQSSR